MTSDQLKLTHANLKLSLQLVPVKLRLLFQDLEHDSGKKMFILLFGKPMESFFHLIHKSKNGRPDRFQVFIGFCGRLGFLVRTSAPHI